MIRPAMLALALFAALPTQAAPRHTLGLARVSVSDLDLSTSRGATEMLRRLNSAAHALCDEPPTLLEPGQAGRAWRCRREAVSAAVERLKAPRLAMAWKAERSGAPDPGP